MKIYDIIGDTAGPGGRGIPPAQAEKNEKKIEKNAVFRIFFEKSRYLLKNPLFYPLYTENATDFGDVLQHRCRLPFPVSITPHLFVF